MIQADPSVLAQTVPHHVLLPIAVHSLHQRIDFLLELTVVRVDAIGSAHGLTRGDRDRRQLGEEQLLLQWLLQLLVFVLHNCRLQLRGAG